MINCYHKSSPDHMGIISICPRIISVTIDYSFPLAAVTHPAIQHKNELLHYPILASQDMSLSQMWYILYMLYLKGLQHKLWSVCSKFWPALLKLLTDEKKQQFRMCFQQQSCTVPWLPGPRFLSHSSFLWETSAAKDASSRALESKLQPCSPLALPLAVWLF